MLGGDGGILSKSSDKSICDLVELLGIDQQVVEFSHVLIDHGGAPLVNR